jgi:lipoprotein NlpI
MRFAYGLLLVLAPFGQVASADEVDNLLNKSRQLIREGKSAEAITLADKAIALNPKLYAAYFLRGEANGLARKPKEAIADYEKALSIDPTFLIAVDRRGGERFKLGMFKESIEDFDAFLKANPKETAGHWRRGISYYYVGKYQEGAQQFDDGQAVFGSDAENAFWYFLCLARKDGVEKARAKIFKIGTDRRVPMMKIYDMIKGDAKPEEVIATATAARLDDEEKNEALFYANLYVGLYFEATGNAAKCKEHLTTAVGKHKIGHYMWDVGNVHLKTLTK